MPDPYKDNRDAAEGVGEAIEGAFGKLGDALDIARGRPAPPPAPPADEHHGGDVNITINQ